MPTPQVYPALTRARNVIYLGIASVLSIPFLLCFPLVLAPPRIGIPVLETFFRMHGFLLGLICGLTYEVTGKDNLPKGACLIASAHQSSWETVFFHLILGNPAMLAKKELFRIPILGQVMRTNSHIELDRNGPADAVMASFRAAKWHIKDGRHVVIFPTGTRARDDDAQLKTRVAILYRSIKRPVVPIVLNSGKYVSARFPYFRPGTIKIHILPPIPVGLSGAVFMDQLYDALSQPSE